MNINVDVEVPRQAALEVAVGELTHEARVRLEYIGQSLDKAHYYAAGSAAENLVDLLRGLVELRRLPNHR